MLCVKFRLENVKLNGVNDFPRVGSLWIKYVYFFSCKENGSITSLGFKDKQYSFKIKSVLVHSNQN